MLIASYILAPYRPHLNYDWNAVKPLLKFGGWLLVTSVIAMGGNFGFRIIVSRQLGADALGLFFLAAQLAFLPSEIASEVVGTVAFPLFSRLQTNLQQAKRAFQAILSGIVTLLFPISALIIVLSPILVQDVLGTKWNGTVPLIQILAIVTMIGLLGDATIPLVKGFGQTYRVMMIEMVQSSVLISMILVFTRFFDTIGTALAWLPTIIAVQILCLYFIQDIFHDPLKEARRPIIAIFSATLAGAGMAYAIINLIPNIFGIVMASALSIVLMISILWFSDQRFSLGLVQNILITFPQAASVLKIIKKDLR
jgi:O-antigen/teichoic acid export membrane protein